MSTARKNPQDRKRKPAEGDYTFEHDGETYALPAYKAIKSGLIRSIRKLSDVDATYTILEKVSDEVTLAALDDMESGDFNEVMKGWLEHSGITLGE